MNKKQIRKTLRAEEVKLNSYFGGKEHFWRIYDEENNLVATVPVLEQGEQQAKAIVDYILKANDELK